jgi:ribonuclease HI
LPGRFGIFPGFCFPPSGAGREIPLNYPFRLGCVVGVKRIIGLSLLFWPGGFGSLEMDKSFRMRTSRQKGWLLIALGSSIHFRGSGGGVVAQPRVVREVAPDISIPWGYFDGASSSDQTKCGGGGCLYFTNSHYFTLKAGLGNGTNNYSELMALKLLMIFVVEQGCRTLQVFGDSLVVINWTNGIHRCQVSRLLPLLEDVIRIKSLFDSISFSHIYRERNQLADRLSKEATQLDYGQWYVAEHTSAGI